MAEYPVHWATKADEAYISLIDQQMGLGADYQLSNCGVYDNVCYFITG